MIEAGGILVFLSLASLIIGGRLKNRERLSRLRELIELEIQGAKERSQRKKVKIKIPLADKVEIHLAKAGLGKNIPVFLATNGIVMSITYAIGNFYLDETLGVITAFFGPYLVWSYLQGRIKKRGMLMLTDFRDFLRYAASYLGAGAPYPKAVEKAAQKIGDPLKTELLAIVKDIKGGQTIERAINEGANRIPLEEYKSFVMATEINMSVGGNLSLIYEKIAADIDSKIKRQENIKAYTAQGRLTTRVVGSIPFAVVGFIRIYSPEFYEPVANDPIWKVMYIASVGCIIFGIYLVKQMTISFTKGVS